MGELLQRLFEPGDVFLNEGADAFHGLLTPIFLGGHHADQLGAPFHQRAQLLGRGFRDGAGRGADRFAKMGQHCGVQPVGLGQASGGLGEGAHLARIDHATGNAAAATAATASRS